MFKLKKVAVKLRKTVKISVILTFAVVIILCAIDLIFRQTYSVSLNGEHIGYTSDKIALQKRINEYINYGNKEDIAFVEVNNLPTYSVCMLKKNVETNDDEIFSKVTENSTAYYTYYAITEDNEEKVYVANFQDAESVLQKLKDKNSDNSDKLGIVRKYDTSMAEITSVDDCVSKIYKEKPKKIVVASAYQSRPKTIINSQSVPTNLGVSLVQPISGVISSRFGLRRRDNHKGLDIAAPKGTAIMASAGGTVIFSGSGSPYSGYGNTVVVQSSPSVVILYGHCTSLYVRKGETVAQGQVIASVGSTGISTGNHLHFEIRYNGVAVNPQNYIYN